MILSNFTKAGNLVADYMGIAFPPEDLKQKIMVDCNDQAGTIAGGAIGAASAAFNIGTGTTAIVNKAHGSTLHKMASNVEAGKMATIKASNPGIVGKVVTWGRNLFR